MKIDTNIKKQIKQDWLQAFPDLEAYALNKFCRVVGPIAMGIEMIRLSFKEAYRPYFMLYGLWRSDPKLCMDVPVEMDEFKSTKGFQLDILYAKHQEYFNEAQQLVRRQTILPYEGNIHLSDMYDFFHDRATKPPMSAAPGSAIQAQLLEDRMYTALYLSTAEAEKVVEEAMNREWDAKHFSMVGMGIAEWQQRLRQRASDRDGLLAQISANLLDKKIAKLKRAELIL